MGFKRGRFMMNIDLRNLNLEVAFCRVIYNPQDFVKIFKLQKEFEKEFNCKIEDWNYDLSDDEVYETLIKYINKPDKVFFTKWNENLEENELYQISYRK